MSDNCDVNEPVSEQTLRASRLSALVSTALVQTDLAGLADILRCIGGATNAQACILYRVMPSLEELSTTPSEGHLSVLDYWAHDDRRFASHELHMRSLTGQAVLHKKTINCRNIGEDDFVGLGTPSSERMHIQYMCSVPMTFFDGEGGALNLYRSTSSPFTKDEVKQIEQLASLVPVLYQAIKVKVGFTLTQNIDRILRGAKPNELDATSSRQEIKKVLQRICDEMAAALQCMEVSLFLEDPRSASGRYELMATTWRGRFGKIVYRRNAKEGLTGWVLTNAQPVRILDLGRLEREKERIRFESPDVVWTDSRDIRSAVRDFLKLGQTDHLQPISFMAAPFVSADKVLGVIRCCVGVRPPYQFAQEDFDLLQLVAAQISQYWSDWLSQSAMQQENREWRSLVETMSRLNRFVHNELARPEPDALRIFNEALRAAGKVIEGSEIMDIRLLDGETQELYFAGTYGKAWNEGSSKEINERKLRRFPVNLKPPRSAGARVFQTNRPFTIVNVRDDPYYSETFPGIKSMIIAPISIEDNVFGVLDIRIDRETEIPNSMPAIVEIIGQHLGLYCYQLSIVGRLRKTEAEMSKTVAALESLQRQKSQTFEDLVHQLRNPITQAHARVQMVLKDELTRLEGAVNDGATVEKLRSNLLAIRGLCGKAKRVAIGTGLFAVLAGGEPIRPRLTVLRFDDLIRMLIAAAVDNQRMIDPAQNITFNVDRQSFELLRSRKVEVDIDLFEQALSNILDNAGKYSFPGAKVRIYGGLTHAGRFHTSVANRGIPIYPHDVQLCIKRGWRSDSATSTTGEGTGIGLWLVDHIMRSHGGDLIIIPTTAEGITEFKLVFPSS